MAESKDSLCNLSPSLTNYKMTYSDKELFEQIEDDTARDSVQEPIRRLAKSIHDNFMKTQNDDNDRIYRRRDVSGSYCSCKNRVTPKQHLSEWQVKQERRDGRAGVYLLCLFCGRVE
jgi:hypothetical protein